MKKVLVVGAGDLGSRHLQGIKKAESNIEVYTLDTNKSSLNTASVRWDEILENKESIAINNFIVLQPTSPLRTSKHIDEAITLFENKEANSVISYCKEDHPIFWHKFINDKEQFEEIFTGDYIKNRQEIKDTYCPNGAIFVFDKSILETGQPYTAKSYAYIMDRKESVDIDTIEDFEYVEFLIKKYL